MSNASVGVFAPGETQVSWMRSPHREAKASTGFWLATSGEPPWQSQHDTVGNKLLYFFIN